MRRVESDDGMILIELVSIDESEDDVMRWVEEMDMLTTSICLHTSIKL